MESMSYCVCRGLHAPGLSFYTIREVAFPCTDFDRNLTATGCPYLSLCVLVRNLDPDKSAVLSLPVPPCRCLSLSREDSKSGSLRGVWVRVPPPALVESSAKR